MAVAYGLGSSPVSVQLYFPMSLLRTWNGGSVQLMAEILLRSSLELETDSWELKGQNSDREKSSIFFKFLA